MNKSIRIFSLIVLLSCNIMAQTTESSKSSIRIKLVRDNFATLLNERHKGNRIGYRFFEHSPIVYGRVPLSDKAANIDTAVVSQKVKKFLEQNNVFVYKHEIPESEDWVKQIWTYYMAPAVDGVEILWVIETFGRGLPDYYGVQQCFRMSGETNVDWRKTVARTPAFSEYDLWAQNDSTSLSYVYRDETWHPLPVGKQPIGARTPLGIAIDHSRTKGQPPLQVGPYTADMLEPADEGLITRTNKPGTWVCGIYWQGTSHVTDHHPADCLHAVVNIGNIPPFSKRALRGKIYWFEGTKDDLTQHFRADFSKMGELRLAACQFPVSADTRENADWIKRQMRIAKIRGADIVHFPEAALSGYAGADIEEFSQYDWKSLESETDSILTLAKALKIWVLLGSTHRLTDANKPHNSLYLIDDHGQILDRYDKRFCTGGDLKYYSPGDHFVTFELNGVRCGLLICYDIRFPELYRQYRKLDVDVIFQSFYNARHKPDCIHPKIMPVTAQARAATNYFYMSLTNSCAPFSWPCHFITPDGLIAHKLSANEPGILMADVDISKKYYDASKPYRTDAIDGKLNSGEAVEDSRSRNRQTY